jgi:hypothetical protein
MGVYSDAQIAAHIHVYPNPVSKNIHVQAPLPVMLTITGVEGRILRRQSNTNTLVVEDLPQGVYLLQIADEQGVLLKTVKFVKN